MILWTAAYLVLGFYVFYLVSMRSNGALSVFDKDPCRQEGERTSGQI